MHLPHAQSAAERIRSTRPSLPAAVGKRVSGAAASVQCALAGLCLLAVAGCASLPGSAPAPLPSPIALELGAGKDAETCFRLAADERIEYQFKSTAALHFNLHTHRGRELYLPVDIKQTRTQSGFYVSPAAEDYCMMWTNPGAIPAHIEGQWRRVR